MKTAVNVPKLKGEGTLVNNNYFRKSDISLTFQAIVDNRASFVLKRNYR